MNEQLACVASVSVGFSACLKHFSLFERAKIGASAKKCEKGEGKGPPSPYSLLPSVLRSPQFLRRQKAKNATNGQKNLRKRRLMNSYLSPLEQCTLVQTTTTQMKATEQYFPVVLFVTLYKVVRLTFDYVREIRKCDHSNESY